ncbi:hypothetical protein BDN72DRAFT_832882 [Pluteus cervinus]|uniref:Uncharacterized protein n=1 Tax=Pluteus cervinus TaxID=181527 RepID=A0ACD3BAQ4_9AGAR|nr:hypothetical protein BDN72DRAFT_832882 [Pluteus cervinus]
MGIVLSDREGECMMDGATGSRTTCIGGGIQLVAAFVMLSNFSLSLRYRSRDPTWSVGFGKTDRARGSG